MGGSGAAAPLHNLVVQLLAIGLLAVTLWHRDSQPFGGPAKAAILLLVLLAVTPILQLLPLPHCLWETLPARGNVAAIEAAAGINSELRSLTIDPEATWLAAAYLLPPAAIFFTALRMDEERICTLLKVTVAVAFLSLALGALQFATNGAFTLYNSAHRDFATGLFINRNHQADLLLIAMILSSALLSFRKRGEGRLSLWLAIVAAFSAGVLATSSRMAFLLLPLAIAGSGSFLPLALLRRRLLVIIGLVAVAAASVAALSSATGAFVLNRLESFSDDRFGYWPEVIYVVEQYLPWGSGIGTFATAFALHEDLNRLDAPYLNHAHNDYLQIVVEAGLWGGLLTAVFLAGYAWLAIRTGRDPLKRAASLSILILLLHALVDYPFRIVGLLTVFALLCGVLIRSGTIQEGPRRAL